MTISDRLNADELEILVQERTAELEKANQVLRSEIIACKEDEKALRHSEKHYRLLFETMLQGVVYQDADGKIISMNPAAERILGKTREEFLGSSSVGEEHDTIREDGSPFPGMEHPAMVSLRTGRDVKDVVMGVYNPREKSYRWININAVPVIMYGEDKPFQVYTLFNDITESKKAQVALHDAYENIQVQSEELQAQSEEIQVQYEELQAQSEELSETYESLYKSEQQLQAILDGSDNAFYVKDLEGRFILINKHLEELLGMKRDEVYGKTDYDLFTPELADFYKVNDSRILKSGVPEQLEEFSDLVDGHHIFLTNKFPLYDSQGKPYAICGISTDITERKRIDEALKESEEKYRNIVETANEGIWVVGADLRTTYVNEKMADMLGYPYFRCW